MAEKIVVLAEKFLSALECDKKIDASATADGSIVLVNRLREMFAIPSVANFMQSQEEKQAWMFVQGTPTRQQPVLNHHCYCLSWIGLQ